MAFSYVTRSGNGSQKSFTFSFEGQDEGYIREEDLVVTVDGASASFTLTSSNTLEISTAPPVGEDNILIRRVMPKDLPYADFQRGNNFGQEVLNNSFLQLLYVVHELLDGYYPGGLTSREVVNFLKDLNVEGDLAVSGFASVDNSNPSDETGVVRFKELDKEKDERVASDEQIKDNYQAADSNIQKQLSNTLPLEASAFSPISWHDPIVENSVTIPDNKNAWSFGPTVDVAEGQSITIGDGSFWTIANGVQQ